MSQDRSDAAVDLVRVVHARLNGEVPSRVPTDPPQEGRVGHGSTVALALPEPATDLPGLLTDCLRQRRSVYDHDPAPMEVAGLSSLLRFAVGEGRRPSGEGAAAPRLGLAPSAGGLPSIDAYVVAWRVEGLPPGVHRYDRRGHELVSVREEDVASELAEALLQPEFAARPAACVVLVGRLDLTVPKYSARHYTTLHVDAGIAVQNLYLVATALGLGGCAISGFRSQRLEALLRLPRTSLPLIAFAVGRPRAGTAPA